MNLEKSWQIVSQNVEVERVVIAKDGETVSKNVLDKMALIQTIHVRRGCPDDTDERVVVETV